MKNNIWLTLLIIISFTFLLLSYIPNFYEASVINLLPQDRIMLWGEHIYSYDYNAYLSKIKQGAESRWSVVDKYDNNPRQKGVFLQMLYLLSGKFGALLRLTPALIFHLLRTILSFSWVWTIIYLNIYFLKKPKYVLIGVLFSLLAASFPVFYRYQNQWWAGNHMSWWTEMDVLKRISYIPHYTLNYIIISLLTILLSKYQKTIQQSNNLAIFLFICLLLFFSFFIHPSAGILFLFSWFIYHLIKFLFFGNSNIQYLISNIVYSLILLAISAIPLLYFSSVTSNYPWKSLTDFDKYFRYPVDVKEYILALGPVFFTGVLGSIIVLIKRETKYLSLVSWVFGAFIAIYVFKRFPYQSELRFVQTANHIPLAILSVYFFKNIVETLHESSLRNAVIKIIIIITVIAIIFLGFVQSFFSIKAQTDFIHQRAVAGQPLVPYPPQVMYPLKDFWNALVWLEKNTSRQDVVLSQVTAGNYIPAYSGNFVYLGHNPETPFFDQRSNNVNRFFSGTMNTQDAYRFLKQERITYVFYGPQEKEKSIEDIKKYSFLKPVFNSYFVTLYKINLN